MSTIANLEKIGDKEAERGEKRLPDGGMSLMGGLGGMGGMGPMGLMGLITLDNTAEAGKLLNRRKTNAGIGIKRLHNLEGMKMRIIA